MRIGRLQASPMDVELAAPSVPAFSVQPVLFGAGAPDVAFPSDVAVGEGRLP